MAGRTIGYARTASNKQDIAPQIEALNAAGCMEVFTDVGISGATLNRSGLQQAMLVLEPGDTLMVTRLDRIAPNTPSLVTFGTYLARNAIELKTVDVSEAGALLRLIDRLNYGPAVSAETPLLRKLAYRLGAFFIRISGRGAIPSR